MVDNKKLIVFLAITFGITYGCWWTLASLTQQGILEWGEVTFMLLWFIGGLGPTIAPFIAIPLLEGKEGIKNYKNRLFKWRISGIWYLASFLILFAESVLFLGIYFLISNGDIQHEFLPFYFFFLLFPIMIICGGLEELGWRGLALPELQEHLNATGSTIILAIIWSFWHLPLFFIIGVYQYGASFLIFMILMIPNSFILSWLYNNTESIIICVLYHAFFNLFIAMGWLYFNCILWICSCNYTYLRL